MNCLFNYISFTSTYAQVCTRYLVEKLTHSTHSQIIWWRYHTVNLWTRKFNPWDHFTGLTFQGKIIKICALFKELLFVQHCAGCFNYIVQFSPLNKPQREIYNIIFTNLKRKPQSLKITCQSHTKGKFWKRDMNPSASDCKIQANSLHILVMQLCYGISFMHFHYCPSSKALCLRLPQFHSLLSDCSFSLCGLLLLSFYTFSGYYHSFDHSFTGF